MAHRESDIPIVVVKVGTSTVVREGKSAKPADGAAAQSLSTAAGDLLPAGDGELAVSTLAAVADTLLVLRRSGYGVILVSSGAVGLGCRLLGIRDRPSLKNIARESTEHRARALAAHQAFAAVGQSVLMRTWQELLSMGNQHVAQVLLTSADLGSQYQFNNARNTLVELLHRGVIPVVNENDTVATDELRYGDNDWLSALVATSVGAEWLFLLSDIDYMCTADPRKDKTAKPVLKVEDLETLAVDVGEEGSHWGTGGMRTKISAARLATAAGIRVCLMNGKYPDRLLNYVHNTSPLVGTLFEPVSAPLKSQRKLWISNCLPPRGVVTVDDGANRALRSHSSLLAVGVISVSGTFERNSAVKVVMKDGTELARGLSNYSSSELAKFQGKHTNEITELVGHPMPAEVIHRHNLALLVSKHE